MESWKSIADFLEEENYYYNLINKEQYYYICKKHNFIEASLNWIETPETKDYPDVVNNKIFENKIDIRGFFDHSFSFKDNKGEIFWVVCPYRRGMSKKLISEAFKSNYIKCDIEEGFYADYTIIMKPENLRKVCYQYAIDNIKNNYYVIKYTNLIASEEYNPIKIGKFKTEQEAKAFIKGIEFMLLSEVHEIGDLNVC